MNAPLKLERLSIGACVVQELVEQNTLLIALYDDPQDPEEGIRFERALHPTGNDFLGPEQDTYFVALSRGPTAHGGISSCVLDSPASGSESSVLYLVFEGQTRKRFNRDGMVLRLKLSDLQLEALREGLARMFAGEDLELELG